MVEVTVGGNNSIGKSMVTADTWLNEDSAPTDFDAYNYGHSGAIFVCASTVSERCRGCIKIQIPDEPYPSADLELRKIKLYLYGTTSVALDDVPVGVFLFNRSELWQEGLGGESGDVETSFELQLQDYVIDDGTLAADWNSVGGGVDIAFNPTGTETEMVVPPVGDTEANIDCSDFFDGATTTVGHPYIQFRYQITVGAVNHNIQIFFTDLGAHNWALNVPVIADGAAHTVALADCKWVDGAIDLGFFRNNLGVFGIRSLQNGYTYRFDWIKMSPGTTPDMVVSGTTYADTIVFRDDDDETYDTLTIGDGGTYTIRSDGTTELTGRLNDYNYDIVPNGATQGFYSPTKYLLKQTYINISGATDILWDMSYDIANGCSWENVNEYTDTGDWGGSVGYTMDENLGRSDRGDLDTRHFPYDAAGSYQYVAFSLNALITKENKNWGDEVGLSLIAFGDETDAIDDTDDSQTAIYSRHTANSPYCELIYFDPPPKQSKLTIQPLETDKRLLQFTWDNVDDDVKQLYFQSSATAAFTYNTANEVTTNKGTPVTDTDGSNDKAPCYSTEAMLTTMFLENDLRYVAMYIEDNNNIEIDATHTYATKSNEVQVIRPTVALHEVRETADVTHTGNTIHVKDEVFLHIATGGAGLQEVNIGTNDDAIKLMKKVIVNWGDGTGTNEFAFVQDIYVSHIGADIVVGDATKFNIGDRIVICDYNVLANVEYRTITGIAFATNTITVDSALTGAAYIDGDPVYIANNLRHKYSKSGTFYPTVQTENDQGFRSDIHGIITAPQPQNISPIASLKSSPTVGFITGAGNPTFRLDLRQSYSRVANQQITTTRGYGYGLVNDANDAGTVRGNNPYFDLTLGATATYYGFVYTDSTVPCPAGYYSTNTAVTTCTVGTANTLNFDTGLTDGFHTMSYTFTNKTMSTQGTNINDIVSLGQGLITLHLANPACHTDSDRDGVYDDVNTVRNAIANNYQAAIELPNGSGASPHKTTYYGVIKSVPMSEQGRKLGIAWECELELRL